MIGSEVTIILAPGLEEKARQLAHALTIENIDSPEPSTIGELISLLLPDLITNALAGDMLTLEEPGPPDETSDARMEDISKAILEAEQKAETPEVMETLTQSAPEPEEEPEAEVPSFSELCAMAEIHSDAVSWAKGNPSKEAALIETCVSLPTNMWSWSKVLELAERTYQMRMGVQKDMDNS